MGAYRELLAQAKKANHTAIQKLYERYYTLLRSYSFVNGRFDEDLFHIPGIFPPDDRRT